MYTVKIEGLDPGLLFDHMAKMRAWLDHNDVAPSFFRHIRRGGLLIFCVEFKEFDQAKAFAGEFGGKIL